MPSIKRFSQQINENAASLAGQVVQEVVEQMNLSITEEEEAQTLDMYRELLVFFSESLAGREDAAIPEALVRWSKKNAEMQVQAEGKISEIVVRYPPTREVFSDIFTKIGTDLDLSLEDLSFILCRINRILDISLNETFFAFERLTEQRQKESSKELIQLSAPIVPVKEDTVVLPLIGYLDGDRIKHIMENVVPQIAEMNTHHVIVDFSGVLTIDDYTAEAMNHIGGTLKLMGIHIAVAGLRPALVQLAVNSGIELSEVESYHSVKQALKSIGE